MQRLGKQLLRAQEHSRNNLLEREKPQMPVQKLTFNVTYYPAFQNVCSMIGKTTYIVIGFRKGKNLRDYLVRATLPKLNESGRCETNRKKSCLICDSIRTATNFTTEACQETFKTQSGFLNCESVKAIYLLTHSFPIHL